jgi:hypothetical protein
VSDNAPSAAEALAELAQRRGVAQARVDELEREQREATAAAEEASLNLVELERHGVSPGGRRAKLEKTLAEAKARAAEPWAERIAGGPNRSATRRQSYKDSSASIWRNWSPTAKPKARQRPRV